jgi:DNA-binding GntR family transcriptional regulator
MQSRADAVFEALRRAVLEGKLLPGEPLRQETLATEFGVSQITVRDALNKLVAEGLAVRAPYKGVRVIELSAEELGEAYSMRANLEGWAAELAAIRITAEDLAELRRLLPDSYVTVDPTSVERARQVNRQFHEVIIRAGGHKLLARMLRDVWNRMDPMILYGRTLPTQQGAELRLQWGERDRLNHTALLAALENRDGPRARQLVTDYVQEVWNVLIATWDVTKASGSGASEAGAQAQPTAFSPTGAR